MVARTNSLLALKGKELDVLTIIFIGVATSFIADYLFFHYEQSQNNPPAP